MRFVICSTGLTMRPARISAADTASRSSRAETAISTFVARSVSSWNVFVASALISSYWLSIETVGCRVISFSTPESTVHPTDGIGTAVR